MKPLRIADAHQIVLGLQDEIRRIEDSRYDHRLHGVLLVAQGFARGQVAQLLGDGTRTVQSWVHRFEKQGFGGLQEQARSGRPRSFKPDAAKGDLRSVSKNPKRGGTLGDPHIC